MSRIVVALGLALFLALICNASAAGDDPGPGYPRTIADSTGRMVTIQQPIERIIVLNPEAADALKILGATDKIVGVVEDITKKEYLSELQEKEIVGTWKEYDYEKIANIARNGTDRIVPDIIVISYANFTHRGLSRGAIAVREGLSPFGNITIFGLDFYNPENLTEEMAKLGSILGREDVAERYCDWYEEKQNAAARAADGLQMPRVYIEGSSKGGSGSLWTFGNGSALDDLLRVAGGDNIAGGLATTPQVSWEWVIAQNPDVIIRIESTDELGWNSKEDPEAIREEILNRPGAESISAIKTGRVYTCYWDMFFGMDGVVGLTYLAEMLHPDAGLDPERVYEEYLQHLGLMYPEGRIFVYPEPKGNGDPQSSLQYFSVLVYPESSS